MPHDDAHYYRADWMTDDQWACAQMVADLLGGFHHVSGDFNPLGYGLQVNLANVSWATHDFNTLTRAVFLAHARMIRFEIRPCSNRSLKLCLWQRHKRDGAMGERHPTIQQALEQFSKSNK
ncbi:hypothetical protein [Shimia ponticola]|uniref:hypothetical protein n=1 Tax=Shimia ponticola TaxID=2582893 RepID=UPI0011BD9FFA|nr:hypothetical protein [Shimia ponticola]